MKATKAQAMKALGTDKAPSCWHGHTVRVVGCVSCVLVFDRPADRCQCDDCRASRRERWPV
jgi:hypothetical protein